MSDTTLLALVAQGLPEEIEPGETWASLKVETRAGTMCLYVLDGQEIFATFGPTEEIVFVCAQVWIHPSPEEKFCIFDTLQLGQVFHGMYYAFFQQKFMDLPVITGSLKLGQDYQAPQDALDAHTLMMDGMRKNMSLKFGADIEVVGIADPEGDDFDLDRWAEDMWVEMDNEEAGPVGNLSAFEDFVDSLEMHDDE